MLGFIRILQVLLDVAFVQLDTFVLHKLQNRTHVYLAHLILSLKHRNVQNVLPVPFKAIQDRPVALHVKVVSSLIYLGNRPALLVNQALSPLGSGQVSVHCVLLDHSALGVLLNVYFVCLALMQKGKDLPSVSNAVRMN